MSTLHAEYKTKAQALADSSKEFVCELTRLNASRFYIDKDIIRYYKMMKGVDKKGVVYHPQGPGWRGGATSVSDKYSLQEIINLCNSQSGKYGLKKDGTITEVPIIRPAASVPVAFFYPAGAARDDSSDDKRSDSSASSYASDASTQRIKKALYAKRAAKKQRIATDFFNDLAKHQALSQAKRSQSASSAPSSSSSLSHDIKKNQQRDEEATLKLAGLPIERPKKTEKSQRLN